MLVCLLFVSSCEALLRRGLGSSVAVGELIDILFCCPQKQICLALSIHICLLSADKNGIRMWSDVFMCIWAESAKIATSEACSAVKLFA